MGWDTAVKTKKSQKTKLVKQATFFCALKRRVKMVQSRCVDYRATENEIAKTCDELFNNSDA